MQIKKLTVCVLASILLCLPLHACSGNRKGDRETLTIMTAHKDYTQFEKAFKQSSNSLG